MSTKETIQPEPVSLDQITRLQPCKDANGTITMEQSEDGLYVPYAQFKLAMDLLSSDKLNGRCITNANFIKVVDLTQNAIGCLKAIATTSDLEGTVSQRFDMVKQVAGETAEELKKALGG